MLRLKIDPIGDGQHPSEIMVAVETAEGSREILIVDRRSLEGDTLGIGYPVGARGDLYLVELPQETMRGLWRVWVKKERLVEKAVA